MRIIKLFLALGIMTICSPLGQAQGLKGDIKIDGSSTVYLITEAMATNFKKTNPAVNITVGIAGTGGGFKKFAAGETDISDASRAIKAGEAEACKKNNIHFVELQVGWDGLAVIIHPDNTWAKKISLEQLKKIWHPNTDSFKNARTWKDVDASWPDEKIELYGAGGDSGTFDYFTEVVNGKERVIRPDYSPSEDDNFIVQGVIRNKNAMGFLGVAYYEGNKNKLSVCAVAKREGEYFEPSTSNVLTRKYPISRPLFIYVKTESLKRPEVAGFVQFYMRRADLVTQAKYVAMSALTQYKEREKLDKALKAIGK